MERRQKDITTMAEIAELTALRCEKRNGRQFVRCRADNGVEREFSISLGSRSDPRGDQNELSAMKRFARENAEQTPYPKTRETLTMQKVTAKTQAAKPAVQTLTPVDFYKVCEWIKTQAMPTFPNLEALALGAAKHIGAAVHESDITTAMETVGVSEPPHWAEPTDPHAIIVRELATMMKELGHAASPAFSRLATHLLPTA